MLDKNIQTNMELAYAQINTELAKKNNYNVTNEIPLGVGVYYTSITARTAVPAAIRKTGLNLTYSVAKDVWITEQFVSSNINDWNNNYNWLNDKNILNGVNTFRTNQTLAIGNVISKTFNYPMSSGNKIRLSFTNISKTGTGSYNINIKDSNGTFLIIKYGINDEVIDYTLTSDSIYFTISLGYAGTITAFTANVNVLYGDAIDIPGIALNTTSINEINTYVVPTKKGVALIPNRTMNYSSANSPSDYIYGTNVYFGYNKPVAKNCIVDYITMMLYGATSAQIGTIHKFVVGSIDQRNWLLPRIIVDCPISAIISGGIAKFDFSDFKVLVNAGEVIFMVSKPISGSASLGLRSDTFDPNNKLLKTSDLATALVANNITNAVNFQLNLLDIDSIFTTTSDLAILDAKVATVSAKTNNINLFRDYANSNSYEIKVINGVITLQNLNFDRILVIGHSFVTYGNSPEADWYLDDGENRAMSPSINSHQWTSLIKNKLGSSSLEIKSGVVFERTYSPDFDFSTNWNVTNNYDAILVYLNENAVYSSTMQASWEVMLNYLKTAAPSAKIFCTGSWAVNNKQQAIQSACENVYGITYVDLVGYNLSINQWSRGDYYLGRSSTYYPIGATNAHPNDKGHLDIANVFLAAMGNNPIEGITHNITLNQSTGGSVETVNATWLENGIVTIRINPVSGYQINSLVVEKLSGGSIVVTQRTNNYYNGTVKTYYTFTMPNDSVVVTPSWSLI